MGVIRVLLVDDHPPLRAGVRGRLEREEDIVVVGEAGNGVEALEMVLSREPHVMVLDMELPSLSGLEVARQIQNDGTPVRILALSAYSDSEYVSRAMENGVSGYLTKQESLDAIVEAVRGVARGEDGWLSRAVAAVLMKQRHRQNAVPEQPIDLLSHREREVLRYMAEGLSNQQIGETLFISDSTVKKHVNSIYTKLEMHSRAEVVAWAWKNGLTGNTPAQ